MASEIDMLIYTIWVVWTAIWSGYAVERKHALYAVLSMFFWFTLAGIHLVVAVTSDLIFISYAYFGLGFIFLVMAFVFTFQRLAFETRKQELELDI